MCINVLECVYTFLYICVREWNYTCINEIVYYFIYEYIRGWD